MRCGNGATCPETTVCRDSRCVCETGYFASLKRCEKLRGELRFSLYWGVIFFVLSDFFVCADAGLSCVVGAQCISGVCAGRRCLGERRFAASIMIVFAVIGFSSIVVYFAYRCKNKRGSRNLRHRRNYFREYFLPRHEGSDDGEVMLEEIAIRT